VTTNTVPANSIFTFFMGPITNPPFVSSLENVLITIVYSGNPQTQDSKLVTIQSSVFAPGLITNASLLQ